MIPALSSKSRELSAPAWLSRASSKLKHEGPWLVMETKRQRKMPAGRKIRSYPNPTIIEAVSEDDETESRGHPSTAVALRPRRMQHHPRVDAGWRSRHCPIAHGCRARWPRGLKIMSV